MATDLILYTTLLPHPFPYIIHHSILFELDHLFLDTVDQEYPRLLENPPQEDILKIIEQCIAPMKRDVEDIRNITLKAVLYCHTASRRKKIEHTARCVYINKQHSIALKNARRFILPHRKLLFK